jgi:glucose uptake protein
VRSSVRSHPGPDESAAPVSFFHNLDSASVRSLVEAFAGGMIFNLGNLLLVAAISIAGMAVAFPLGAGLALVIGAVLNYAVSPKGNPLLLFGGILLVCAAIAANAMAYRGLSKAGKAGTKGILLSLLCGVVIGLFYPFVAKALTGENHLGPYTVYFVFALGALVSNFPLNYAFMRRPVSGSRFRSGLFPRAARGARLGSSGRPHLGNRDHLQLCRGLHAHGGAGNFVFARRGQYDDFRDLGRFRVERISRRQAEVKRLLALMFALFVLGLVSISLAPGVRITHMSTTIITTSSS